MKKGFLSILLCALAALMLFSGCEGYEEILSGYLTDEDNALVTEIDTASEESVPTEITAQNTDEEEQSSAPAQTAAETVSPAYESTSAETEEKPSVEKNGSYTAPEDVAEYIHTFGTLPDNFITKTEARALGWDSSKGNLWDVAEGMSIGGDRFGNYEGLLPEKEGRKYTECDVNYSGGYRGGERIIFSDDGLIFYTDDHYQSFTQLY